MTNGSCLCEKIKFLVEGSFGEVRYCHCTKCRKTSGSAFSANAKVSVDSWRLVEGASLISEYEQSPGVFRAFCSACGAPLYARLEDDKEYIRVRLGSFEGAIEAIITAHVWVSSKSEWFKIEDDLPCYLEGVAGPPL